MIDFSEEQETGHYSSHSSLTLFCLSVSLKLAPSRSHVCKCFGGDKLKKNMFPYANPSPTQATLTGLCEESKDGPGVLLLSGHRRVLETAPAPGSSSEVKASWGQVPNSYSGWRERALDHPLVGRNTLESHKTR